VRRQRSEAAATGRLPAEACAPEKASEGGLETAAMAVTKSWEVRVFTDPEAARKKVRASHNRGLFWLLGASSIVIAGLILVYVAKTQRLAKGEVLNLNQATSPE